MELFQFLKYGLIRSIISKCAETNETGKLFSTLAIIAASFRLIGSSIYRQLYNLTLDTFAPSEIVLKGVLYTLASVTSFMLYLHKWRMDDWNVERNAKPQIHSEYIISHM